MKGIDFSKHIDDNYQLSKGYKVTQWSEPNQQKGKCCNKVKQFYEEAIPGKNGCKGTYDYSYGTQRIKIEYTLHQHVIVFKSISADVIDA